MPQRKSPIPRRSSGVQVRVGKSTRSGDTRDARDDAQILGWLQRIDLDLVRSVKQPFAGTPSPPKGDSVPTSVDPKSKKLADEVERIGTSAIAFNRAFETARKSVLELAIAFTPSRWLGIFAGIKDAMRVLMSSGGGTSEEESSQAGTKTRRPVRYSQIGDALRGSTATKEVSWAQIRSGMGSAPAIQSGPNAGSQTFTPGPGAFNLGNPASSAAITAASAAPRAGSAVPGLLSGVALGTAGGIVAAVAAIGAVAIGLAVLPPLLAKFGASVFDANKAFAVSGAMATVIAQQNIRDVMRNMSTGDHTAGSAAFLGRALGDLKDNLQPMVLLIRNVMNLATGVVLKVASFFTNLPIFAGKSLKEIMEALNKIIDNTTPELEGESMGQWLDGIAQKAADRKTGFMSPFTPFAAPGTTRSRVGPWQGGSSAADFGGKDF